MIATVGGQCEGYSGLFMALSELLPVEHSWYAETDEAASKVLAAHYPGVPNHGDITAFDWATADPVDIFTSGFPCQGFSMAGKRQGSADERHLWPTGVLPAITALMPRLVVLENVPGLLTIEHGQVFGRVLADLDALGYRVSWTTVGACKVGACHHRHRIFIAATLVEVAAPMSDPVAHRTGVAWSPVQDVLFGDTAAVRWPQAGFTADGLAWESTADVCGADGVVLPTPTARDGMSGPGQAESAQGSPDLRTTVAMFPTPTARDASRGAGWGDQTGRPLSEVIALLPTPTVADSRGTRNATAGRSDLKPTTNNNGWTLGDVIFDGRIGSVSVQPERFGAYAAAVHRHELAYGLAAPDPTEPGRLGKPRLSAAFPEFMQGLPPGWPTDHVARKDAVRLAGNGVNPRQAAYALPTLPTFRAAVAALTADPVPA